MNFKLSLSIVLLSLAIINSNAQNIGINALGVAPNSASILDLNTGNTFTSPNGKGFLPPNVALTGRTDVVTVNSPPTSLLVYNTATANTGTLSVTPGYYYWNGTLWVAFSSFGSNNWALLGNAGTTSGTNFLGTTDNQDLVFKRNNVQSGLLNSGNSNTSFGVNALNPSNTGVHNTAIGVNSLLNNTSGGQNTAYGSRGLTQNTTGFNNTAIGFNSLPTNTTGFSNTASGVNSLEKNTTGSYNTATGVNSLDQNTTGQDNTANGYNSIYNNTTGTNNTAYGVSSLYGNTTGSFNMAFGTYALQQNTTGDNNHAYGHHSLYNSTTGNNNIGFGTSAGSSNVTGSNNTFIGVNSNATSGAFTNATAIGYNAQVGASNSLVLGNSANVGIGTTTPTQKLEVNGNALVNQLWISSGAGDLKIDNAGTANTMVFTTSSLERMRIDNNGKVGIFTSSPNTRLDLNGSFAMREGAALALGNGINNNITLVDFSFFRITGPTGAFSITGLTGGVDGRLVTIYNTTSQIMTITNEATSTAANQIRTLTGANIVCPAGPNAIQLQYNANVARWILIGGQNITSSNSGWSLLGNAGTTAGTNFLGTTDNQDLVFKRNGVQAGLLNAANTSFGVNALNPSNTGNSNTAIGASALMQNTTGSNNNAVGTSALMQNTTGGGNTAIGNNALRVNTSGNGNISIGTQSLFNNTTGGSNVAIGEGALSGNISGFHNTAIGFAALGNNTASDNVAIGANALIDNTSGNLNVAVGRYALQDNTTGPSNTAIGWSSLGNNISGGNNTACGFNSLGGCTGNSNTGFGSVALGRLQAGNRNTAFGDGAALGQSFPVSFSDNCVFGYYAGNQLATGANNNILFGYQAGSSVTTGSNNIVIGYNVSTTSGAASRELNIGNLIYGTNIYSAGNIGIGISSPAFKLDVNGTTACTGNVWTSDVRKKKEIKPLTLNGLEIISKLKPVTFEWKEVLDAGMKGTQMGFIAQDLEKVLPTMVLTGTDADQSKVVKYNELLPVFTKAIQEQQKQIEEQHGLIEELKKQMEKLQSEIKELKK